MTLPALIRSPLVLWANSSKNVLHDAWQSNGTIDSQRLTQGDVVAIELHWIKDVVSPGLIHDEVEWPAAANITLAIGLIDAEPESGVFNLSYGGQTTADIPFNATGVQLASALNALSSVSSAGGITAVKSGTSYKVVWNNPGVLASSLSVASNDLLPQSTINIAVARAGTPSVSLIYNIHIKQAPVAACTVWENPEPASVSIELESTVGLTRTWVLRFSKVPRSGSLTLQWVATVGGAVGISAPISLETIGADNIYQAIESGSNYDEPWFHTVTSRSPTEYAISFFNVSSYSSVTPVSSLVVTNLIVKDFSTKVGLLSLNTLEVESLLAGQTSVDVVMEVEVELNGERLTIVQAQAYIVNDLIDTDVYDLVQWGDVIPADSVVRFDTAQALTSGQQTQARNNIGALGASSLTALTAKDAELEQLITTVTLSTNELNAIKLAATPSATNLFLTRSASDALYAATSHQHLIANIVGLQTTLTLYDATIGSLEASISTLQSSKANSYHTQPTSTITGLDTVLANFDTRINGFAPFNHTHTIAQIEDLEGRLQPLEAFLTASDQKIPTAEEKAAMMNAEAPSGTNAFVTESRVATLLASTGADLATETWTTQQITDAINALGQTFTSVDGTQPNPSTGPNLLLVNYPEEVLISQNGQSYWIPARSV
jgi:hypothetical protein